MAIDSDITIANLVTEALKNAGRVSPSATQISEGTSYQFRRVKSDIALKSSRHEALKVQAVSVTVNGQSRYTWPTNAHLLKTVTLLTAPTDFIGTASAGASTTLTLSTAVVEADANNIIGKFLVTTGGTGSLQIRQVVNWNNTSKVATVESAWTTTPDNTTTYLLATSHRKLWSMDKATEWDTLPTPGTRGMPTVGAPSGREFWLNRAPDTTYVLWWDYYAHLDLLDNTSDTVLKHIRMYYTLWSQGLSAWFCQRYDEDRYQGELGVYNILLELYESEASKVNQLQFTDI